MNTSSPKARMKARATLVAVAAVFALPLALAWMFSSGLLKWLPENSVNYGALLKPPLRLESYGVTDTMGKPVTVDAVARDWILAVVRSSACTEQCQGLWEMAERLQIAVGRDRPRITLASLGPDDGAPVPVEHSWLLPGDGRLVAELSRSAGDPQLDTALLVVDFQGLVVLMYPHDADGPAVLEDLKRLLRATAR